MDHNNKFDKAFKIKVEKIVSEFKIKENHNRASDIFDVKELNLVIKNLNKKSSCGEDKIHNLILQNSTQEFRKIILKLLNESIKQS
jgi:hypothetical protein